MPRETKTRPTLKQANRATVLLVSLSLALCPFTLLLTLSFYILSRLTNTHLGANQQAEGGDKSVKTVLITGARANKALTLIRAFKRSGCRVIAAEEEKWGRYAMSRFSRGVDNYHFLPDSDVDQEAYIHALQRIISAERIDAWVPCSTVQATMLDSEAAKRIREGKLGGKAGCECFIPEPIIAGELHWKDQFEALLKDLGIAVPDSKVVTSVPAAVDFLHAPETLAKGHRYLLKCLTLDDLGRDDFTLLPLATPEETFNHLSSIPTPISAKDPFLLQQFLHGPEYCTHVAARCGRITAFVACRSNQLLMRYADVANLGAEERARGHELEAWSQRFLDLYQSKLEKEGKTSATFNLTGHFSFDFIYEENEQTLYVLECNLRAHTAVCLLSDNKLLGAHYLGETKKNSVAYPAPGTAARSWLAHALPLTVARWVPRSLHPIIHPQLFSTLYPPAGPFDPTASPFPYEGPIQLLRRYLIDGSERDGVWDWSDPWPFFALCHITWPWLLLNRMWRGVAWSRVNVSTSRVFEC